MGGHSVQVSMQNSFDHGSSQRCDAGFAKEVAD
jgi:hypothetical protein